jgi:hypothetical protein
MIDTSLVGNERRSLIVISVKNDSRKTWFCKHLGHLKNRKWTFIETFWSLYYYYCCCCYHHNHIYAWFDILLLNKGSLNLKVTDVDFCHTECPGFSFIYTYIYIYSRVNDMTTGIFAPLYIYIYIYIYGLHVHACTYLLLTCSVTYLWLNITTVDIINYKGYEIIKKSGVVLTASFTTWWSVQMIYRN